MDEVGPPSLDHECECCGNEYAPLDDFGVTYRIENSSGYRCDGGKVIAMCPNCKHEEPYGWAGHAGPQGVEGPPSAADGSLVVYDHEILEKG